MSPSLFFTGSIKRLAVCTFLGMTAFGMDVPFAPPAIAHDYQAGVIEINHPWARATPPGARNGAAYVRLSALGTQSDTLIAAASPVARRVELHTHMMEEGVMRMRPVEAIEVAPGSPTVLQPGGLHIMLLDLTQPLEEGTRFPLNLTFERAGTITVEVSVEGLGGRPKDATPDDHSHGS